MFQSLNYICLSYCDGQWYSNWYPFYVVNPFNFKLPSSTRKKISMVNDWLKPLGLISTVSVPEVIAFHLASGDLFICIFLTILHAHPSTDPKPLTFALSLGHSILFFKKREWKRHIISAVPVSHDSYFCSSFYEFFENVIQYILITLTPPSRFISPPLPTQCCVRFFSFFKIH